MLPGLPINGESCLGPLRAVHVSGTNCTRSLRHSHSRNRLPVLSTGSLLTTRSQAGRNFEYYRSHDFAPDFAAVKSGLHNEAVAASIINSSKTY